MKLFRFPVILFFMLSILWSEPGDLVEYNYQNNFSVSTLQFILNSIGEDYSNVVYPISVYDIKYESLCVDGSIDTLSGLVSIPQEPLKAFPLLSYLHGTTSLDSDAPSITGMSIDNAEILLVGLISTPSGFITIFPDYEGIGDPNKFHPYIVAESYTNSVVDMIKAVKQLSYEFQNNDDFQLNDQLFLMGYSEGGYATLATQRGIQLNYSDEIIVTASFPMAGPYDLSGTMVDHFLSIPSYPSPYYVPYVLTSHLWTYEGLDVDFFEYFNPFWADTLPSLYDGTHSGSEINNLMPDNPLDILLEDVLQEFSDNEEHFFRQTLSENTLLDWTPESPIYFYHGTGDDIIPYQNSQVAYDAFIENGAIDVNLNLFPEELGGHSEIAFFCLSQGFQVINDLRIISVKGDMNNDGYVSLVDMDQLSFSILNYSEITDFEFWAGDLDNDFEQTIIDILYLIDNINR